MHSQVQPPRESDTTTPLPGGRVGCDALLARPCSDRRWRHRRALRRGRIHRPDALGRTLFAGPNLRRSEAADEFGAPRTAFNVCSFWRIDALAPVGRPAQAREAFDALLAARHPAGMLSEDFDPRSADLWGNLPQIYSMVGIVNGAVRLSRQREEFV
jgi:hypothetical protein